MSIILQEYLDIQAGVNEISPKGGRALGACIAKFRTWKDLGIIAYKQSLDCNVIPLIAYFTVVWSYTEPDDCFELQTHALRYILRVGPKTAIPALHGKVTWVSNFSRHVTCYMYYTTMKYNNNDEPAEDNFRGTKVHEKQ